jgi:DNA repair ATPase RecN
MTPHVRNVRLLVSRRKEVARMASGDMSTEEAEVFAEALIRDLTKQLESRKLTI